MIEIKTSESTSICLPNRWGEVPLVHLDYAYKLLAELMLGHIEPFEFQMKMLIRLHGIKISRTYALNKLVHWLTMSGTSYRRWYISQIRRSDNIMSSLVYIAEKITFAFYVDDDTKEIKMTYDLPRNPFPDMGECYFDRRLTVETNITASQFADVYDLETALQSESVRQRPNLQLTLMRKIAAVLYKITEHKAEQLELWQLVLIRFWAQSITAYFVYHPVYGLLYKTHRNDTSADDRVALGISETILQLEKSGYQDAANMDLIRFYMAQIKELKDYIGRAIAAGVKPIQLANDTGLDISVINRLTL